MTTKAPYDFGDIVSVYLPYEQVPTSEDCCIEVDPDDGDRHPVLIVSTAKHNTKQDDLTVLQCTSNVEKARSRGEYVLVQWTEAGFLKETAIRPKLYIVRKSDVLWPVGQLLGEDVEGVRDTLRDLLGL